MAQGSVQEHAATESRSRTAPIVLDALGPTGPYRSRTRQAILDIWGNPTAELSLVPALYTSRAIAALRKGATPPVRDRLAALQAGGELFATGTVAGMTADEYALAVSRTSGTPLASVHAAIEDIRQVTADCYRSAQAGRPAGAVDNWRDPRVQYGTAVWTRRGEVLWVHAAGNHPGVHAAWPEALALGYRVAVRPSRREPLTPYRLISALRESGFDDDQVVLLPTDHDVASRMLREADLSVIYGGQEVIDGHASDPNVLPNGPGRSKILVTAGFKWREHLDVIVDSIARYGGAACFNTTAVFVEGDPEPLAAALAGRLSAIPSLPAQDERATLPVQPHAAATAISDHLVARAKGTRAWLGGDGVADDLGDGSAALRPALHELDSPYAAQANIELPFPCAWVAPWTREAGTDVLQESLVLTAMTSDERLLDELIAVPSIKNVYIGGHPTCGTAPGVPHDGFLGEFLMRSKGVIRD